MILADALNAIIDDGIEAARYDYREARNQQKMEGAIRGFEECRNRSPSQLVSLLCDASDRAEKARQERAADYWYWRCRHAEIEWVANVLSCILQAQGLDPLYTMTARGMMKAADIIGASDA